MVRYPCVIAYDISSNRTRRKVYKVLQSWRLDGQKSVVETELAPHEAYELYIQLAELIDPETDRLALAWLRQPVKVRTLGEGRNSYQNTLWRV